jgi:hypothetical protein
MTPEILRLEARAHITGYIRDHDERIFLNELPDKFVSRVTYDAVNEGASDARYEARAEGRVDDLARFARSVIHETLQVTHLRVVSPSTGDYGWRITVARR